MIVLFLVAMLVVFLVKFWYVVLGMFVVYLAWICVMRLRAAEARRSEDILRHARARREIDAIAFATVRAMHEAAARGTSEAIEGSAVEVRR